MAGAMEGDSGGIRAAFPSSASRAWRSLESCEPSAGGSEGVLPPCPNMRFQRSSLSQNWIECGVGGKDDGAGGKEAAELSSLKPQLEQVGVPLYAVVKENIGTEVANFRSYFKGEIFLDEKRKFYGPQRRTMMFLAIFRWNVWRNFWRAWRSGYTGNIDGEGVILGGVFVIGPGKQGVLLEHREKEFGDKVSLDAVLDAVKKIKAQPSDRGE